MTIKFVAVPESLTEKVIDLWIAAFGEGSRSYWRSYASEGLNRLYGAVEGDEVLAVAGSIDFDMRFADQWMPGGGIAAVATHPDRRGQGLAKRVLTECLLDMRHRKIALACLGTAIHSFYERLGWSISDWANTVEIGEIALAELAAGGDADKYEAYAQEEALDVVMPIHEQWVSSYTYGIRRDRRRWLRQLTEPGFAGEFHIHAEGYMLIDRTAMAREGKCVVAEWAYLNERAFRDGLALLSSKLSRSSLTGARWRDAHAQPFANYHGQLKEQPTITVRPGGMSRVVDLAAFAERLAEQAPDLRRRLQSVGISDPLGVTAAHNPYGIGPGELVQLVTGFRGASAAAWPAELAELSGIAGQAPAFCAEVY